MIRQRLKRWGMSRRSGWLVLFGITWIAYGCAVHGAPQEASLPIYATVPTSVQGWAWVAVGIICLLTAIIPGRRIRSVGFAAAPLLPMLWALGFAVFTVQSWIDRGWAGTDGGWQGFIVWGAVAGMVVMAAGDAEVKSGGGS